MSMTLRGRLFTLRRVGLIAAALTLTSGASVALWTTVTEQATNVAAATVPAPTAAPTVTDTATGSSTTTMPSSATSMWSWQAFSAPQPLADTLNDGNSTTCDYTPPGSSTATRESCADLAGIAAVPNGGSITVTLPSSVPSTVQAALIQVQTIGVNSSGTETSFPVSTTDLATTTTGLNVTANGVTWTWTNDSGSDEAVVATLLADAVPAESSNASTFEFVTPNTLCAPGTSFTDQCATLTVTTSSAAQTVTLALPSSLTSLAPQAVLVNVAAYGTLSENTSPLTWGQAAAEGPGNAPLPLLPIDLSESAPSSPALDTSVALLSPTENTTTIPVVPSSSGTVTLDVGALENPWASSATASQLTSTSVTLVVQVVGYLGLAPHTVGSETTPGYGVAATTPWSSATANGTTIGTGAPGTNTAPAIATTATPVTMDVSGTSQPNASGLAADESGTVVSAPLGNSNGELLSAQINNGGQSGPATTTYGGATVVAAPTAESTSSATITLTATLQSGVSSWNTEVLVPNGACITSVTNATASGSACNVAGETGYAGWVIITPTSSTATPSFTISPDVQNSVVDLPGQYELATSSTNGGYGGTTTFDFGDLLVPLSAQASTSLACSTATTCGTLVLDTQGGSIFDVITQTDETEDPTQLSLDPMGTLGLTQGAAELAEITTVTVDASLRPAWAAVSGYTVSPTAGATSLTDAVGNTYSVQTSCGVAVVESSSTTLSASFTCTKPVVPAGFGASSAPSSYVTAYNSRDYISGTSWTWRSTAGPGVTITP